MTSVKAERASPQQLLAWNRGHWVVESHHHVRDATFREDDSMLRTRPQTTRSPSQSSSATSCPNPSTASSTPLCRQTQAGPARNHKTRLTAPLSPTETASLRARQPNSAGLSLAPDTPTNRAPRRNSASANLKIAVSNASTRAAIRTPITSHQQAWDHLASRNQGVSSYVLGKRDHGLIKSTHEVRTSESTPCLSSLRSRRQRARSRSGR